MTAADRKAMAGAGGSTAAVLWLMILIVFLPIALAHVVARYVDARGDGVHAAAESPRPGS